VTSFAELIPSAPKDRFDGVERPYGPEEVLRLRGSFPIAYTLAERGALKLWQLLREEP
jgi:isocitrate lyase